MNKIDLFLNKAIFLMYLRSENKKPYAKIILHPRVLHQK